MVFSLKRKTKARTHDARVKTRSLAGARLAREDGLTFNTFADCQDAFAGKPRAYRGGVGGERLGVTR
jgi:hypothetical protein